MRKEIIFMLVLAAAFAFVGCHSRTAFEGNWDLVSKTTIVGVEGEQFSMGIVKDADNFGMKMIHDGYWMFTGQETNNNQKSGYYGYSTYTVEDNILTEHIKYHSVPYFIGTSPSWEMTVEGDKLILKGPLKIGDFKDTKFEITETYMRKTTSDTAGTAEVYNLVSVDGMTVPASVSHGGATLEVRSGAFTINADGTCSSKMVFVPPSGVAAAQEMSATYTRDGSKLTMQWNGAGETVGSIDGNTFTMENEGMVFVYRK